MATLSRPPSMPPILEGFLNLGGDVLPVLRIAQLFNLPDEPPHLHTPLVVLRCAAGLLGLLVTSVTGVADVPANDIVPMDAGESFNACVESQLTISGETVHLLSVDRLLLEKESRALADFQEAETRRLQQFEAAS